MKFSNKVRNKWKKNTENTSGRARKFDIGEEGALILLRLDIRGSFFFPPPPGGVPASNSSQSPSEVCNLQRPTHKKIMYIL